MIVRLVRENNMEFKFTKALYPKIALLKSAYSFTDRAYIHLDADKENYIVRIEYKDDNQFDYHEFENEMLSQTVRYEVYRQTKELRRLTVARALASTIIEETSDQEIIEEDVDIDNVLQNWFDKNE